ncbi:MAG: hypothetical protein VE98_C0001G0023 [candidate division Kazan bacterium GW2011_GWA1_50_15]|uniref:Uncharacterized protein n=2 Tax=Bacteria division Kazan-3B-28 TaxID=1798534 RepID=A0A0G2A441_UNCK3|nr:MAG: hypothetical protein VE98_C0001G0023 [candidate division Kazan bacterium GW2011_GWA1_50_15]KKW25694.1 MAG: hypothetical protein VE99_C0001G0333 [candidate division Kazan bacterium GW2011_GWC1_52_13]KKW26999.1 MAG: hypothetical protein VF00_C0002G0326 [candidate division Kazan bacterium GW2011_GWB1_52_7]HAV66013.1 hypothetical protein [Patescibacteria group bacterium]HCR42582.1 hypothetical protein [Patescibacteria group bacterium]
MTDIPKGVVQPSEEGGIEITQSVAELPEESEAPEASPYLISFAKYNERECQIADLQGNMGKKALLILKAIGTKIKCIADFATHNVERRPIRREGDYLKLYRGLSDDIDLHEANLQSTGRIFYFDVEPDRLLYVVAITNRHFETGKVRR